MSIVFGQKATKARQAQSRIKALERMEKIAPAHVDSQFNFRFRQPEKLPQRLLNMEAVRVGYGEITIIAGVRLQILPGERIGLIGPNGAGKSTLIKFLAGELPQQSGECWQAQDLKVGYFAQHQLEQLDPTDTALQHLRALDRQAREQELRNYLGGFGFHGARVDEPVAPFSGGEKARLALALLIYQKPNLLLLDEPTNHLDLEMRLALSMALQAFEGAMVIVSHDRHMLKTVTDTLLLVDGGRVDEFDGDLDDYAVWLQSRFKRVASQTTDAAAIHTKQKQAATKQAPQSASERKDQRREAAEKRKQLQPLKKQVDKLEKEMQRLEQRQGELEAELAEPEIYTEVNKERLKALLLEQGEAERQLEEAELSWMEVSEEYEILSAN